MPNLFDAVEADRLKDNFWVKVDKEGPISPIRPELGPCWIWKAGCGGPRNSRYGNFWVNGHNFQAHRFAYILHRGQIPEGLTLDHLCEVKICVNPDHLEAVTQAENVRRSALNHPSHCYIGIWKNKRRWRASIQINKRKVHLGYFDTPEEAGIARAVVYDRLKS